MGKFLAGWILIFICTVPCFARDFIVEFVEENYQEAHEKFSYDPLIYHSIQVNSSAGPKVLVLAGKDYHYRKWVREYIAQNKQFIARIKNERADEFITSTVFTMDISQLHPFNLAKWKAAFHSSKEKQALSGADNILIVDPDQNRTQLISTIVKDAGYAPVAYRSAKKALESLRLYSGKYRMILINHQLSDMETDELVRQIAGLNPAVPIVVDTGYRNQTVLKKLKAELSSYRSVVLKPMLLKELSKTIVKLLGESA